MYKLAMVWMVSLFSILTPIQLYSAEDCDQVVISTSFDGTENLILQLQYLIDQGLTNPRLMKSFYEKLLKGELTNPVEHDLSVYGPIFNSASKRANYYQFEEFLKLHKEGVMHFDLKNVSEKLEENFEALKLSKAASGKISESIKHPFIKMKAITVEKGEYKLGGNFFFVVLLGRDSLIKHKVKINSSFEAMSTPVTQYHWARVMEEAPRLSIGIEDRVNIEINGNAMTIQGDHPTALADFNRVDDFLARLNELSQKGDPRLDDLFEDHQQGDVYDLLTENQMAYLMKMAKTEDGEYFQDLVSAGNRKKVAEYAWFKKNSEGTTHPVGVLKPLFINDQPLYDLHGNVWTIVYENFFDPFTKKKSTSERFAMKGGSSFSGVGDLTINNRYGESMMKAVAFLGFRLVRKPR